MNTGMQDAYNLGWKLAAVLRGADAALLDTYDEERRPIARAVLEDSTKKIGAVMKTVTDSSSLDEDPVVLVVICFAGSSASRYCWRTQNCGLQGEHTCWKSACKFTSFCRHSEFVNGITLTAIVQQTHVSWVEHGRHRTLPEIFDRLCQCGGCAGWPIATRLRRRCSIYYRQDIIVLRALLAAGTTEVAQHHPGRSDQFSESSHTSDDVAH